MQARCRESGGAHGLKTIGVVPVKKPRRCFGADSMQFLLHARRTRRQSKRCLRKATAPAVASSPSSTRASARVVQSKITSLCVTKKRYIPQRPQIICRTLGTNNEKLGLRAQRPDKGKDRVTAIQAGNGLDERAFSGAAGKRYHRIRCGWMRFLSSMSLG